MKQLKVQDITLGAAAVVADTGYGFTADHFQVQSVHIVWTSTTASATVALQYSNDGTNWVDFTSAQAIANNNGNVFHKVAGVVDALYWRAYLDWTSGSVTTLRAYLASTPRT